LQKEKIVLHKVGGGVTTDESGKLDGAEITGSYKLVLYLCCNNRNK
jgi:hypothetical protein